MYLLLEHPLQRESTIEYGIPQARDISRTDAAGNIWVETYDRKHRILSETDPSGHTAEFAYDKQGNVIWTKDPMGNVTAHGYDEHSNRIATTNALRNVTLWKYNLNLDRMTEFIDPLGSSTFFEYDASGNLTNQYDALGRLMSCAYYANGLLKTLTDANGNTSSYTYTSEGFPRLAIDPLGHQTRYMHNELGWVLSTENALTQAINYVYNSKGKIIRTVDALHRTNTFLYDGAGNLITSTDANGNSISNVYDEANQLIKTVNAIGATQMVSYTELGLVERVTDAYGNTASNVYDSLGRLIEIHDQAGRISRVEYNANGECTRLIDPLGNTVTTYYDALNRPVRMVDPLGNVTHTTFDACGLKDIVTLPKGNRSKNEYDSRGRLVKWTDPKGYEWVYQYDHAMNITNVIDANGGNYTMAYGPRNERLLERNQDGMEWSYVYDELLRLREEHTPDNLLKTYRYDAGGRLIATEFSTGRVDERSYDDNDNVTNLVRNSDGGAFSTTLWYDDINRIVQVKDSHDQLVRYEYDLLNRKTAMIYPGGDTLTNQYNTLGQLVRQIDWEDRETVYSYDKTGRLTSKKYPNGTIQTNIFDDASRLTTLQHKPFGKDAFIAYNYAYDVNGNLTQSSATGIPSTPVPVSFDETASYTPANRLIDKIDAKNSAHSFDYDYDSRGNMTNAVSPTQSYSFTYDEDNRVRSVGWATASTNVTIHNTYDALGRRVARSVNGKETRYVLDLSGNLEQILCETDTSGAIKHQNVFGYSLNYSIDSDGTLSCYHANSVGSTVAISDQNTNIVAHFSYSPYGKVIGTEGNNNLPYKFVGTVGIMEELPNLYFMHARYYSADTGTFLSTDPYKPVGPGWKPSAYQYALGNPLLYIDSSGLDAELIGVCFSASMSVFKGGEGSGCAGLIWDEERFNENEWQESLGIYMAVSGAIISGGGGNVAIKLQTGGGDTRTGVNDLEGISACVVGGVTLPGISVSGSLVGPDISSLKLEDAPSKIGGIVSSWTLEVGPALGVRANSGVGVCVSKVVSLGDIMDPLDNFSETTGATDYADILNKLNPPRLPFRPQNPTELDQSLQNMWSDIEQGFSNTWEETKNWFENLF